MSASSIPKSAVHSKPLPHASTNPSSQMPSPSSRPTPNRIKLIYDIVMIIIISIDLFFISVDAILISEFSHNIAGWLSLSDTLSWYEGTLHHKVRMIGGFFTLFLIAELCARWVIAIKEKVYYRWFFFPFVHWYEVLGCFPQLRALRLFRAVVIGRRLYQLGYQVLPQPWIKRIKFYINLLLEELSDRVILTTIYNYKQQLTDPKMQKSLIDSTITNNRAEIETTILSLLRQELIPQLQQLIGQSNGGALIAKEVGNAIQDGFANTPELHRLLRLIPIAGRLIESELQHIGQSVGEQSIYSFNKRLLNPELLDSLMVAIAHGIAHIDTDNPALQSLIASIVSDSLSEFEAQIKVQHWKHRDQLKL